MVLNNPEKPREIWLYRGPLGGWCHTDKYDATLDDITSYVIRPKEIWLTYIKEKGILTSISEEPPSDWIKNVPGFEFVKCVEVFREDSGKK